MPDRSTPTSLFVILEALPAISHPIKLSNSTEGAKNVSESLRCLAVSIIFSVVSVLLTPGSPLEGKYADGVRVDEDFRYSLLQTLSQIKWETGENELEDMIADGLNEFSKSIKCKFINAHDDHRVRIGGRRLNIQQDSVAIKRGELTMKGYAAVTASGGDRVADVSN